MAAARRKCGGDGGNSGAWQSIRRHRIKARHLAAAACGESERKWRQAPGVKAASAWRNGGVIK